MAVMLKLFKFAASSTCNYTLKGTKQAMAQRNAEGADFHDPHQIPIDIRTAMKRFNLKVKLTSYVCCPQCCCLYLETESYPDQCSYKEFPGSPPCGTDLLKPSKLGRRRPIRRFFYRSPIDWLARMLQRPGIEDIIDAPRVRETKDTLEDVFDGRFLQELCIGPENDRRWFFEESGRYAFAIGVDGFDPDTSRSKKTKSIASMYLALLNFPIQLRYRLENVCVIGMIPGGEPVLASQQINHFIQPVVNDFKVLWKPGVWLTHTHKYPLGRTINVALGLIINDLKAARPVGGFVATAHKVFCSCCDCRKDSLHDLDRVGTKRSAAKHVKDGKAWKNARSQAARDRVADRTGARWTPLMELEYFDGPRMTVPEALHTRKNAETCHNREYFGMAANAEDTLGEGTGIDGPTWPDKVQYHAAEVAMVNGVKGEIDEFTPQTAQALALVRGIPIAGVLKADVVAALHRWVRSSKSFPIMTGY